MIVYLSIYLLMLRSESGCAKSHAARTFHCRSARPFAPNNDKRTRRFLWPRNLPKGQASPLSKRRCCIKWRALMVPSARWSITAICAYHSPRWSVLISFEGEAIGRCSAEGFATPPAAQGRDLPHGGDFRRFYVAVGNLICMIASPTFINHRELELAPCAWGK